MVFAAAVTCDNTCWRVVCFCMVRITGYENVAGKLLWSLCFWLVAARLLLMMCLIRLNPKKKIVTKAIYCLLVVSVCVVSSLYVFIVE